jgi:hypothetical protein
MSIFSNTVKLDSGDSVSFSHPQDQTMALPPQGIPDMSNETLAAQIDELRRLITDQIHNHKHDGAISRPINPQTDLLLPQNPTYLRSIVATSTPIALGTTGAITLDPTKGTVFTITPTAAVQIKPTSFPLGIFSIIIKTSGTSSYTITFDVGFTAIGTLSTGTSDGRYFTATFVCDGINFREVARTAAMLPS